MPRLIGDRLHWRSFRTLMVWSLALLLSGSVIGSFWIHTMVAQSETIVGNGTPASCDNNVLRTAIDGGGTVTFNCGSAPHTILSDTYVVEKDVTIDGGSAILLDGEMLRQIFIVNAGVHLTLKNITLQNGYSEFSAGGAIINYGTLTLAGAAILNSASEGFAGSGGGIMNEGGYVTIADSRIEGNRAAISGGGIHNAGGTLVLSRSRVIDNRALRSGGIESSGTLILIATEIIDNEASASDGGGVAIVAGTAVIEHSELRGNRASQSGGGFYIKPDDDDAPQIQVTIRNSRIIDNETFSQFEGGIGASGGGILHSMSILTIQNTLLAQNRAAFGGGIYSESGGRDAELLLLHSTLLQNEASQDGGGLWTVADSVSIRNSTFSANEAVLTGGGLRANGGSIDIAFSTFYENQAEEQVSISQSESDIRLFASIVAGPAVNQHCSPLLSLGYNLSQDATCAQNATGDLQNTNPLLEPLAANGGSTHTHQPQAGSPAVDAVPPAQCIELDQRGYLRPLSSGLIRAAGDACDRGALERGAEPPPAGTMTPTPTPPPTHTPLPTATATVVPPDAPEPPLVHASVPGAVKATISLSPNRGYEGQVITVSGQSSGGSVRIFSVLNGQTIGQNDAPVNNGTYSFRFTIPKGARIGTLQLCAAPAAAANAEMTCAMLQIEAAPAGGVQGAINFAQAGPINAQIQLSNQAGQVLYTAPIQSSGNFALESVKPGLYNYSVVGQVPQHVPGGSFEIGASKFDIATLESSVSCLAAASIGRIEANPSRTEPVSAKVGSTGYASLPLGLYFSGVTNEVTFNADPQVSGTIQRVIFRFDGPDGKTIAEMSDSTPPYQVRFNVGQLPPSRGSRHARVYAYPVVDGREQCPASRAIEMLANPMLQSFVQPLPNSEVRWDAAAGVYRVRGIIPHIAGVLPSDFDLPPRNVAFLRFLGRYNNRLNAGLEVAGYVQQDGWARLEVIRAVTEVKLMNRTLIPPRSGPVIARPNQRLPVADLRNIAVPFGPFPLVPDVYVGTPFVEVPVITFFGIVDATVVGQAGVGIGVKIQGWVRPLRPDISLLTTATGRANAELGVGLRLLGGIAGVGGTSRIDAILDVPFLAGIEPQGPYVELDACLTTKFSVRVWGQLLWGALRKDETKTLASWTGCVSEIAQEEPEIELTAPDVLPAPSVAAAPDGTLISAYIENRAAEGAVPQMQVVVRRKAPGSTTWSEPQAISNPAHSAADPVVAFAGSNAVPVVAWSEFAFDAAQAAALGEEPVAHLQRTEIVYSYRQNDNWSAPVYLTADLHGDGMPALSGSSAGATLAWTRDLDGNLATRDDQYIAVSLFDADSFSFGMPRLLSSQAGSLNADVQVAYDLSVVPPVPYLVWVNDADADLQSADDRRLVVAYRAGADWVLLEPHALPTRVDSPTVSAGPAGIYVAFLVREASEDGEFALLGGNGVLWTATLRQNQWQSKFLVDESGAAVFAEQPRMATAGAETLLVFRRFGQEADNSLVGQLSVSRYADGDFSPPLYLTDTPEQTWQPAIAVDPSTGLATILKVTQVFESVQTAGETEIAAIAATRSIMHASTTHLSTGSLNAGSASVEALTVAAAADPALDPIIDALPVPQPDEPTTLGVTLRNVGRNPTASVQVQLLQGTPGSGIEVATQTVSVALDFNQSVTLLFTITAPFGETTYHARLSSPGENRTTENDIATVLLGRVSVPRMAEVTHNEEEPGALFVTWQTHLDEAVGGYHVLRAPAAEGPFELAGETRNGYFFDPLVARGTTYCYAVQAYNGSGQLSAQSNSVCGAAPLINLFIPAVVR